MNAPKLIARWLTTPANQHARIIDGITVPGGYGIGQAPSGAWLWSRNSADRSGYTSRREAALTLTVEAVQAGEGVRRQDGGRVELMHPTAGAVTVAARDFETLAALVAVEKVPGVA